MRPRPCQEMPPAAFYLRRLMHRLEITLPAESLVAFFAWGDNPLVVSFLSRDH